MRPLSILGAMQDDWSKNPREIVVDGKSAVLIEPDGLVTRDRLW